MSTVSVLPTPAKTIVVALVGNPNTGKSTLFNALSGLRQRVGNYPGVTVETKKGHFSFHAQSFEVIDLPGTYSLAPRSPDEMVAVDLLLGRQPGESKPDLILSIADASNLERNLYLTTQLLEMGLPVVVALNMVDLAEGQGTKIDVDGLSKQLGIPVVAVQANKGKGVDELKAAIAKAAGQSPPSQHPTFPDAFEREVREMHQAVGGELPLFLVRRLILDVGGYIEQLLRDVSSSSSNHSSQSALRACQCSTPVAIQAMRERLALAGCSVPGIEARVRYTWIREVTAGSIQRPSVRPVAMTDRLDRVLTHRVWGTLIFLALMFLVFQAIFTWASIPMDAIRLAKDGVGAWVRTLLPPGPLVSLLVDGILEGVGSVLVFLPQIVILFGFIAILEDCGYMARAAFLMDKLMSRCGLSGKSFIPMLSSVACAVPGVMATRVIENRRDRLATILVAPLMSCSARLPVYTLIIGALLTAGRPWWVPGLSLFAMYMIGFIVAPLMALIFKRSLLRGETPVFVMEMPTYKWPSPRLVLQRMMERCWAFIYRAGTLILASMIVIWMLMYFPSTDASGIPYEIRIAKLQHEASESNDEEKIKSIELQINAVSGEWKRQSILGSMGRAIEPAVKPLGWDWKIGMAALASFPAREVVVGTLGIIYNLGQAEPDELKDSLSEELRNARWDDDPEHPVFTVPVAFSLMVFFALCCQCVSTLVVIKRETNSWRWPAFTFVYMTVLAYAGAFVTYQVGTMISKL